MFQVLTDMEESLGGEGAGGTKRFERGEPTSRPSLNNDPLTEIPCTRCDEA
ncbi:hypothetical protein GCM10012319_41050 [Comamonas sp. KCTC 72670]|nr:hypothetical protein GCM10012319_41050 [Comamonas sp. KCTC 72670]